MKARTSKNPFADSKKNENGLFKSHNPFSCLANLSSDQPLESSTANDDLENEQQSQGSLSKDQDRLASASNIRNQISPLKKQMIPSAPPATLEKSRFDKIQEFSSSDDDDDDDDAKENIDPLLQRDLKASSIKPQKPSRLESVIAKAQKTNQMMTKNASGPSSSIWERMAARQKPPAVQSLVAEKKDSPLVSDSVNDSHSLMWDWTLKRKIVIQSKDPWVPLISGDIEDKMMHYHQHPMQPLGHHESRVLSRALTSSNNLMAKNDDEKLDFKSCQSQYATWKGSFQSLYHKFRSHSDRSRPFYFYWNHGPYTFLFISRSSDWSRDKFVLLSGLDYYFAKVLEKEDIKTIGVKGEQQLQEAIASADKEIKPSFSKSRHSSFLKRDFGADDGEDEEFNMEVEREINEYLTSNSENVKPSLINSSSSASSLRRQNSLPALSVSGMQNAPSFLSTFVSSHAKANLIKERNNIHLLFDYLLNRKDFAKVPQFPLLIASESFSWSCTMVNTIHFQNPPERLLVNHPVFYTCTIQGNILPGMQHELFKSIQEYDFSCHFDVSLEWSREFLVMSEIINDVEGESPLPLKRIILKDGKIRRQEFGNSTVIKQTNQSAAIDKSKRIKRFR